MNFKREAFLFVVFLLIIQVLFIFDSNANTYFYALSSYVLCYQLFKFRNKNITSIKNLPYKYLIDIYLCIGVFSIISGLLIAKNYWDFKQLFLSTGLVMFLPLVSYIGQNKTVTQLIFYNYIKYALPFSLIIFILIKITNQHVDGLGRFLSPIYFIILFFPFASKKWKIIILFFVLLSFFSALSARSNLIRLIIAMFLMLQYYLRNIYFQILQKFVHYLLFLLPISLFLLAVNGIFNPFKMDEYIKGNYTTEEIDSNGEKIKSSFTADTRTLIYVDVLNSALRRNTWLFGESAVGGYETESFDSLGSKGRAGSEVGILNIFLYTGIIGVAFFTLIFFFSSYLAIHYSNNFICKNLGLFISFRWLYSWVEEFTNFDLNYFFLWLMIGLVLSPSFRKMNNKEMKEWVLGIFESNISLKLKRRLHPI